jgi:hypothetical protein
MANERQKPTQAETLARHYASALHSVTLINELAAKPTLTDNEKDNISRNVKHLEIIVAREGWTTEDLTPFTDAIEAGKAAI